ncbi:MAG TPA: flagellar basal-body MS-ring/collar protein FliF [Rhodospirillales bacterium]|nr:flagellar basal-body MS-ring/collar protein FliF [Rhodospirillales bacterium]
METFLQVLRSLGPMRLAVMGAVILGLIGFFIFLTTRLAAPQMEILFGELESTDSARIISQLESSNTTYELRANGSQIFVPSDKVASLRLTMAERGLSGRSIGYEIFDNAETLGTTNFLQNVNLIHALEGELVRSIKTINSVRAARVHLVIPRGELFSREKQQARASILVKMRGAIRLSNEQVSAIQHLVAAAVPGLIPSRISLVDDKGSLLARGFEDKGSPGTLVEAPDLVLDEALELFFGLDKNDMLRMAEILVLGIVAILVILLVVRPLVSRAFEAIPSGLDALGAEARLLAEEAAPALATPGAPTEQETEMEQFDEMIDIERIEGRVKASSVKRVGEIVDKHPAEALSIVRTWMYQES